MEIYQIKTNSNKKSKKRVGRGGKRGTYSGRGLKGQKSRAGRRIKPSWKETLLKIPKLRGTNNVSLKKKNVVVSLSLLSKKFDSGEIINNRSLITKGIIRRGDAAKFLGNGEIDKPLKFKGLLVSKKARDKIEKVGGEIKNSD